MILLISIRSNYEKSSTRTGGDDPKWEDLMDKKNDVISSPNHYKLDGLDIEVMIFSKVYWVLLVFLVFMKVI